MIDHVSPNMVHYHWNRCRRRHYYHYQLGIRQRESKLSPALKVSKLWDTVQNHIYGYGSIDDIKSVIQTYEIDPYDIAKVKGLYAAFKELIIPDTDCIVQEKLSNYVGADNTIKLIGIIDRMYLNHNPHYFVECKFVSDAQSYLDPFFLTTQVGTYFLLHRGAEYCIMEVIEKPNIKPIDNKSKFETPAEYQDRIYSDILSRPSKYFKGYDHDKKTFGKKFYRTEFNLTELESRYVNIYNEIIELTYNKTPEQQFHNFYKQESGCNMFYSQCEYLPICKNSWLTGQINDDMYYTIEPF